MHLPKVAIDAIIIENKPLCGDIYQLSVACPEIASCAQPGMFVQLQINREMLLLRRPLSIADLDTATGTVTFIYRRIGKGTAAMTSLQPQEKINCLGPLGNGFSLTVKRPLLIGGGLGIAPLLFVANRLAGQADILMGGRCRQEMFWPELFRPYARKIFITTDDGSLGTKGFTIDLLPMLLQQEKYDQIIVCGPEIMMRGVAKIAADAHIPCQVSLEKRMACGLGACLSCSCDTRDGRRVKVCKDGPVFWAQEVL